MVDVVDVFYEKFSIWYAGFINLIPNIIIAGIILIIFILIGYIIKRIFVNIFKKFVKNKTLINFLSTLIYIIVIIIGFFIALSILNLSKTLTSVLAGVGIIGIALGFAFQDAASNLIAGIVLSFQKPLQQGDVIKTNGYFGTIKRIDLRSTNIESPQGELITIPNKLIFENPLENFSEKGIRRVDLNVGISYGEDLDRVKKVSIKALENIERVENRDIEFFYKEFGDSSINFVIRFWIKYKRQVDYRRAVSDSILNIKKAYNREGIVIPFPIRTLDFGIKGGEKLSKQFKK